MNLFLKIRPVLAGIAAAVATVAAAPSPLTADDRASVPSMYPNQGLFRDAILREQPRTPSTIPVTGITVPHHLLAADLMARGFWAVAGNHYDRVILLSPDHFNRSGRPLATTRRDFETVFGLLANDRAASAVLLQAADLFDDSDLFEREHGIAALLPFIKYFLADATIVPIAISSSATRDDWDRALALLETLLGPRVLVVQSTDYSHYLPLGQAIHRDQETLNVIAANDADAVERLVQPAHMDSKAGQYIQMRLQSNVFGSQGVVIGNRNSDTYGAAGFMTTSYIVTVYTPTPATGSRLSYPDQQIMYFGGDTFAGRWVAPTLANPEAANSIIGEIKAVTAGAPLIVNLEGVLLEDPPEGLPQSILSMHADLAIPFLKALNVQAAGIANNHSFDLGPLGYGSTQSILERAGIKPLRHKAIVDVGAVRLVALNFIGRTNDRGYPVVNDDLGDLCGMKARPPLVAFVHWGREYAAAAGATEYAAAEALRSCGVSAVIGAHSHRASPRIEAMQGGEYQLTFSLGNLLFDQRAHRSSGVLLELRVFAQGTYAARLIPLPNLFELGSARMNEARNLQDVREDAGSATFSGD